MTDRTFFGYPAPIGYATCSERVTSPAPSPGALALGLKPNQQCGARVPIYAMGDMGVLCQCPYGHHLHVMPDALERETAHEEESRVPPSA